MTRSNILWLSLASAALLTVGGMSAWPLIAPAGPSLTLPAEVYGVAGQPIRVPATTNGKVVRWYAPDAGLAIYPPEMARDTRTAVVWAANGRYRLVAWTAKGGTATEAAVCWILVGEVPPVPPGPVPPGPVPPGPNPPGPTPGPAPIPGDGLRVLIVYESADLGKMPKEQSTILYSQAVRSYLDSKCAVGPDGKTHEWRVFDKDAPMGAESKTWQDAMKRERKSVPWIIVSNPSKGGGFEGPLPANVDEAMTLLKKFGD